MRLPDHGANPHRLYKELGMDQPADVLDFSENVHPFGPPAFIAERWTEMFALITRYPDPEAEPFRSSAAAYHGVPPDWIVPANGAAELFTALARRYRDEEVLLIEPAFSEYRKTLQKEGAIIRTVQLKEEADYLLSVSDIKASLSGCAALYVCNPHNPTGLLLSSKEITQLAELCRSAECDLVLDEAFIDFTDEAHSFISQLSSFPHVLVIRSMTKMYAIPGLRLGYAVCRPEAARSLNEGTAHWNVNALSAEIGAALFAEKAYRERVRIAAVEERKKMSYFLEKKGCRVIRSAANFLSFRLPEGQNPDLFFRAMLNQGIVLRHSKSFSGMDGNWFRIGMKTASQMEELREAMSKWLKDG